MEKTWENVFVLRQEYNKFQKRWFPVILYWNRTDRRAWVEGVFTENGHGFYHEELRVWYDSITKKGTSKCDQEDVKRILDFFKAENEGVEYREVQKLLAYRPVDCSLIFH